MSLAGAAARGGAVTLAGQLARAGIQFLGVAVLARLISQQDFGLVAMCVAFIGIATVLGDFGLSMAAIQSQTITHGQRSNLFWTNTLIGAVLFGVVLAVAPAIALFYGQPQLVDITRALAVTFLLNSLAAQFRAEVSMRLRFKWLMTADVGSAAVALGVAIFLAFQGAGYWALVAQQITVAVVTLVILVVGASWIPGLPRRGEGMRALYTFGANTLGVQLLTYATSNVDSILVGRVWGAQSLGIYDRAFRLFRLPLQQIAAPMTKVAMPILSRLQDDVRYDAYLARAQLVLGYSFGGAFLLLAGMSGPVIEILLGPGWDLAKPIFAVLAVGGVFQGIGYVYYWVFLSRALTGVQLRWTVISRSATIGLMLVGVAWGPVGVAAAASAGQALNWTLLTLFPMRKAGLRRAPLVIAALRPITFLAPLSIVSFVLSYTLLEPLGAWVSLAILMSIALAYLAAGALVAPIRDDYRKIWDVVRRLRR
ncbi:lipopolysaccharide biosynthesis protein [Microbacterium sp. P05]|uniref:lipopolysaccharide biosynthesis protein n=1 Tax=Microbacterium sp. P05 TaxID=3366948 RepID=UPI003747193F